MVSLGQCYNVLGMIGEAAEVLEKAMDLALGTLGADHPYTLNAMTGLGVTYSIQGRYDESVNLYKAALAASTRILGDQHPDTLEIIRYLAGNYYCLRRLNEALQLLEPAVIGLKAKRGARHTITIHTQNLLDIVQRELQNPNAQSEADEPSNPLHDATVEDSQSNHDDLGDAPPLQTEPHTEQLPDAPSREPVGPILDVGT
jgi:tetratricopeptide (TPR) repeat protein